MNIADLTPDITVTNLLDQNIMVQVGKDKFRKVSVYSANKVPSEGLGVEYVNIYPNGFITATTEALGYNTDAEYKGAIAVAVFVENMKDGTVRIGRVKEILSQIQTLLHRRVEDGFCFQFDAQNVLTPTTPNLVSGYSTTIVNYKWHTTSNEIQMQE